jgi:signal transduction histidine kinase
MDRRHRIVEQLGLARRRDGRWIAGVAGGVANRLGVPDLYVRAAFITLATVSGLGVALYLFLWWLTLDHEAESERKKIVTSQRVGLGVAFVGMIWLLLASGVGGDVAATIVSATLFFGLAALLDRSDSGGLARVVLPGATGEISIFRLLVGGALVMGGLGLIASSVPAFSSLGGTALAVAITIVGLFVAFGPWFLRMRDDLGRERTARARQEERAEMAAHLHDSVLQTLALIQRSEDPKRMASLARTQERELRTWLFGKAQIEGMELLSTALEAAVARIESDRSIAIDLVVVGDARFDDRGGALVAAASEAMVNAANHAGVDRVSAYLEVEDGRAEVWITDQGKGFERAAVPADRRGLSDSIEGRMTRQGGTAEIVSTPGEGTEVHLSLSGLEMIRK